MLRLPGLRALPLIGLLVSCSDYNLRRETPRIATSVAALDFDEVVRGVRATLTFNVRNAGQAPLTVQAPELTPDSSAELEVVDAAGLTLAPGDTAPVTVAYTPTAAGWDYGELDLVSDDPEQPVLRLALSGRGVEPVMDLDPETLWFGVVEAGATVSLSVDVMARGEGDLRISAIEAPADPDFAVELPEHVELPARFAPGEGFSFSVTFTPSDSSPREDTLLVRSNDPEQPVAAVRLVGNSAATGEGAPTAEITSPEWGTYLLLGQVSTLTGVVVDDADPPPNLLCAWYADGLLLGVSTPDAAGAVSLSTAALPEGEVSVSLRAVDSGGRSGEDEVDVTVWDAEEPLRYVLSGGSTVFDWWLVDDDVTVMVNGVAVFSDTNHTQDHHQPIELEARVGDTVRIVANDVNPCAYYLSPLTLHWGSSAQQPLTEVQCRSDCPEDVCYDPTYGGPWPGVFLDESFTISIP